VRNTAKAADLAGEDSATEREIKASGIPYTILRNGWHTGNYTGSIAGALAGGASLGSAGEWRISSAARADYAHAAVEAVVGKGHVGKTYELAGDTAWTLTDLAEALRSQRG
jgi:NAD(P)H dehydrogenase (quinone)